MSPLKTYDARLSHPSTILISGVSRSGKTCFSKKLIENVNKVFKPTPPKYIILIYEEWQNMYDTLVDNKHVHLTMKGFEDSDYLKELMIEKKDQGGTLLMIDDQGSKIDQNIMKIFTIYSHHLSVTCMLLTQTLFDSKREFRTVSLNASYIVIMKNSRDASSITNLAKQTHPYRTRFLTNSYLDATKQPYSYLLIDMVPETPEEIRIRSNIFEDPIKVYMPKDC